MMMAKARRPDIYFHENGQIDITARVSNALALQDGDAVNVWHAGGEYYLYVTERNVKGKYRGVCRRLTAETDISVPISTTLPKASSLSAANVRRICQWVSLSNLITLVSLFL